jgi:hypothetical protein
MNSGFFILMNKFNWQNIGKEHEVRRKYTIFFLCLLFSLIAWLSIKLSKESAATFRVDVIINNIPENVIIVAPSDSVIFVNLQTTGLKLLTSRLFGSQRAMDVEFNMLQRRSLSDNNQYFLTASQAEMRFALLNDLPRSAFRIEPDTIFFSASEAFRKKVPVLLDAQLQFVPGFNKYRNHQLTPDSVLVSGPIQFRDSVEYVFTETLSRQGVYQEINTNLGLVNKLRNFGVKLSENKVNAHVPVEEFTEATTELQVKIDCKESGPDGKSEEIILLPNKVSVHYLVALRDDKGIDPSAFSVFVNCPDTIPENNNRLRVEVREKPQLVEILRIRPSEVEFIVIK